MAKGMDEMLSEAVEMLPPVGKTVVFDDFKAQLYSANPNNGRDVFSYLIRQGLVQKRLSRNSDGQMVVLLSRKE